jgi:hypothetical protein
MIRNRTITKAIFDSLEDIYPNFKCRFTGGTIYGELDGITYFRIDRRGEVFKYRSTKVMFALNITLDEESIRLAKMIAFPGQIPAQRSPAKYIPPDVIWHVESTPEIQEAFDQLSAALGVPTKDASLCSRDVRNLKKLLLRLLHKLKSTYLRAKLNETSL